METEFQQRIRNLRGNTVTKIKLLTKHIMYAFDEQGYQVSNLTDDFFD